MVAIEDDLICSITHELPFNPVLAEDGRVYERAAIEKYFATKSSSMVKSPMTNKMIGKQLFPAVQAKNTIEASIENGYITGDLANNWSDKKREKKEMEETEKKAESGDVLSMEKLADAYLHGNRGFKKDDCLAFKWYDKARTTESTYGLGRVGFMLVYGQGVATDERRGLMYLYLAAEKEYDMAAYWLGMTLAGGECGLAVNNKEAIEWLEKSLSHNCLHISMTDEDKLEVKELLEEVRQRGC